MQLEPDRATAIRRAIESATADDVVVIAGRGHERLQLLGDTEHPLSDVDEVKRVLGISRA